ncbi:hypothetical protein, partial [Novosphingobium sp. MBES04]|uniref:hypothetical protein n=1 Tax=Novosphingobium sp. MBES04 TaxID=1206458 RepID=UPI000572F76D
MTSRSTKTTLASEPHAARDDGRDDVSDIDDLIVRIREAYDAGATISDLHAGLADIIDASMIGQDDARVRFPS